QMKVGYGLDEGVDVGPLINEQAARKVQSHLDDALEKGAQIVCGGDKWDGDYKGYFYQPTILSNITDDMRMMHEETFGPIMPNQTSTDEETVIANANDTDYRLTAYICTENTSRTIRGSEQINNSIVGVNAIFPATPEPTIG